MVPLVAALIKVGLPLLANAVLSKGKEAVEEKLGVQLPDVTVGGSIDPAKALELRKLEIQHEEFLLEIGLKKQQAELDAEKSENAEVTKRWEADLHSDSWLSKNVRPMALVYLLIALTSFAILSAFDIKVSDAYVDVFGNLAMAFVISYVGGRTVEKGINVWQRSKK